MSKRTKYAYTTAAEVFHVWASQRQDSAYQSGSLQRTSFQSTSCYSYRAEIGRLITINGKTVALLNTERYSITTRKHQSAAAAATSHMLQVFTDSTFDVETGLLSMQQQILDYLSGGMRLRTCWYSTPKDYFQELYNHLKKFNALVETLGFKQLTLNPDSATLDAIEANIRAAIKRGAEKRAEKQREREERVAKARAENAAALSAWLDGGPAEYSKLSVFDNPYRLRIKENRLETTGSVSVALDRAVELLTAIDNGRNVTGQQIDGYEVLSIKGDIIQIGCHKVSLNEARELLKTVRAAA
jgi:hypothetical protein